jgi:hypothetical protein
MGKGGHSHEEGGGRRRPTDMRRMLAAKRRKRCSTEPPGSQAYLFVELGVRVLRGGPGGRG